MPLERQLELAAKDLQERNAMLVTENQRLRDEIFDLKSSLFQHSNCPMVHEYLIESAAQIVAMM